MIPSLPLIPAQAGIQPNQRTFCLIKIIVFCCVRIRNRGFYAIVSHVLSPIFRTKSTKNVSRTTTFLYQSRIASLDTRLRGYERAFWGYVNQGKNKKTAMLINVKTERALS